MLTQRRLFHEPAGIEAAEAYAVRFGAPVVAPEPPPPWVWLWGGPHELRVCCEPTAYPSSPAWLLTAWEYAGRRRYVHPLRGVFGRIDMRFPGRDLQGAVDRLRELEAGATDERLTAEERRRRHAFVGSTRRGVLLMWRDDALANCAAAQAAIDLAVPDVGGFFDHGTRLLDPEDYTPPADPEHLQRLRHRLARAGGTP